MASRRMFSFRIINSAKFLKMPEGSQNLYFHLGIRADDDGVVEAYPVMKLLGSPEDNLKILISKGFIQLLNADLVAFVTDFLEHNNLRADRKINSIYKHLLDAKGIKTLTPKPRSDVKDNSKRLNGLSTDGIGEVRLGKVSEDKSKISIQYKENSKLSPYKPYYEDQEMRWSKNKWWVIPPEGGEWKEYGATEKEITWKIK